MGAVAAHAHMSELPRVAMLWLMHWVVPTISLRYIYILACLVLGPLGIFYFVRDGLLERKPVSSPAAFIAGIWYLCNLGTVQHFIVPLEMFAVQYAAAGWLFWMGLRAFKRGKLGDYWWLFVISFLSAPQAYASQLWFAFMAGLGMFLGGIWLFDRKREGVKRLFGIALVLVASNAFWLLPNLYFVKNGSFVPEQALVNQLFSPESFLKNREFGTWPDLIQLKNFLFDWKLYSMEQQKFVPVMSAWLKQADDQTAQVVSWVVFGFAVMGFLAGVLKRNKVMIALIPVLLLSIFVLINANPPFTSLFLWLRAHSHLFAEGLRTPFTKFSILYMTVVAGGFGYGLHQLMVLINQAKVRFVVSGLLVAVFVPVIVMSVSPLWQGQLIHPAMRQAIPQEYFELYRFMGTQPAHGRLALLPILAPWGWQYNTWGYQGAGFLWFGLPQAVLTRDFDRWQPANENFYRQARQAMLDQNDSDFSKIMNHYNVGWLLVDDSLIDPGTDVEVNRFREYTDKFLNAHSYQLAWQQGRLRLYKTGVGTSMIKAPIQYRLIGNNGAYVENDPFYQDESAYIESKNSVYYPFLNLDQRNGISIKNDGDWVEISAPYTGVSGAWWNAPGANGEQESLLPWFQRTASLQNDSTLSWTNNRVTVRIKKEVVASETFAENRGFAESKNCEKEGKAERFVEAGARGYLAESGGVSCDYFDYPDLDWRLTYLMRVQGENTAGKSVKISVNRFNNSESVLEKLAPEGKFDIWAEIRADDRDGFGYVVNTETRSYGRIFSRNRLRALEFYVIPAWLKEIHTVSEDDAALKQNNIVVLSQDDSATGFYLGEVQLDTTLNSHGVVALNQAYDPGWLGYQIGGESSFGASALLQKIAPWLFGTKLEHVKVDGWANGWVLPKAADVSNEKQEVKVVLIYWPQYLQWGGFVILIVMTSVFGVLKLLSFRKP